MTDRSITIAVGSSATSGYWNNKQMLWSDFALKLKTPVVTSETFDEFKKAKRAEQDLIKDVGGYVGGKTKTKDRQYASIEYRDIICLDADFGYIELWDDLNMIYNCAAVMHSTHKHESKSPRLRIIIPLDRSVEPEEYEAISRRIAADLNIEAFDQTTFQVNRMMFWPSVSSDGEYVYKISENEILNADQVLAQYEDWKNTESWPKSKLHKDNIRKRIKKQEDPLTKTNIVGVFCRTYSIKDVLDKFLNDKYEEVKDGRYTFLGGTTAGGLVIHEDVFSFSHHGSDPTSGRLCNAFDLCRIHMFGHLDDGNYKNRKSDIVLPSYKAMEQFAISDAETKRTIAKEKLAEAKYDFENSDFDVDNIDTEWTSELQANIKGVYESSANNLNLIFSKDQILKDTFIYNKFDNKRYIKKSLPWRKVDTIDNMKDVDYSGVRNYVESIYGIVSSSKIDDVLALEFERNSFHPIQDFLSKLSWDNEKRIETLMIDYFGAEDNAYTRAAIKKTLVAAVARVFEPGRKFDLTLTLVGHQKTYKSTFVKKLGKQWFSDTFTTVQGKESFEQLQGAWIIEIAELSGLKKAEVESTKHFLSKTEDMFRQAYARTVEVYKRQCVFIATTNNENFLKDPTGNRRFMPIDVRKEFVTKSVIDDLDEYEIDQIWAEAYVLYKKNEPLYLNENEEKIANEQQAKHFEVDDRFGIIETYLDIRLPKDWNTFDLNKRRMWLEDGMEQGTQLRMYVCVAEIWCECFRKDKSEMSRYNTRDINDAMKTNKNWEFVNSTKVFSIYGTQKYYARKLD